MYGTPLAVQVITQCHRCNCTGRRKDPSCVSRGSVKRTTCSSEHDEELVATICATTAVNANRI